MRIVRSTGQMAALAARLTRRGLRIGVVPTMGALHEGHAALIRAAARECDAVIVTVFVNPLQFGPSEDYQRYPRNLPRDVRLASRAGADIVFAPAIAQLYPKGFAARIEPGVVARRWEGRRRPGHFSGVATVVAKLFHLTQPSDAYFGQKDYQQTLVVRQMIGDLNLPIRLRVLPTVREPDGLAMSSRNRYLNPRQRRQALALPHALVAARSAIRAGERRSAVLAAAMRRNITTQPGVRVDYVAVVDAATLEPLRRVRGRTALLAAVHVGRTRLIDNLLVGVS